MWCDVLCCCREKQYQRDAGVVQKRKRERVMKREEKQHKQDTQRTAHDQQQRDICVIDASPVKKKKKGKTENGKDDSSTSQSQSPLPSPSQSQSTSTPSSSSNEIATATIDIVDSDSEGDEDDKNEKENATTEEEWISSQLSEDHAQQILNSNHTTPKTKTRNKHKSSNSAVTTPLPPTSSVPVPAPAPTPSTPTPTVLNSAPVPLSATPTVTTADPMWRSWWKHTTTTTASPTQYHNTGSTPLHLSLCQARDQYNCKLAFTLLVTTTSTTTTTTITPQRHECNTRTTVSTPIYTHHLYHPYQFRMCLFLFLFLFTALVTISAPAFLNAISYSTAFALNLYGCAPVCLTLLLRMHAYACVHIHICKRHVFAMSCVARLVLMWFRSRWYQHW